MENKIVVCGYYNKKNLGDELYKVSMAEFFNGYNLEFYGPSDIVNTDSEAIIFGGGDVINNYFKDLWKNNIKKCSTMKIALSIGIPYPSLIAEGHLDNFDHVFCRNKEDLTLIQKRIGSEFTHYLPDLAFILTPEKVVRKSMGRIGVFPIPNISKDEYSELKCILKNTEYEVHVYRFDTSDSVNDDINIMEKIKKDFPNSILHKEELNFESLKSELLKLNLAVCFRFHSNVFCTMFGVPFISLSNNRKVKLFLKDNNLDKENYCSEKLLNIGRKNKYLLQTEQVKNIIFFKRERHLKKGISLDLIYSQAESLLKTRYKLGPNESLTGEAANVLSQMISLKITNNPQSKYNYGTIENLRSGNHNLKDMIKWIIEDFFKDNGIVNINYFNQFTDNVHRSGWNYVLSNIEKNNSAYGYILDMYLDRTFHWCEKSLLLQGIIPYNSEWFGFIHHTCLKDSEFNTVELFEKESFIKSLETCKGLIVLTEYLKNKVVKLLRNLKFEIPVFVIYHPTDFNCKKFKMENFKNQVVQVGAWLRDPLAVYKLKTNFRKLRLRGLNMDNYFPPGNLINTTIVYNDICRNSSNIFLKSLNEYLEKRFSETENVNEIVKTLINSVEVISHIDNDKYDQLLSESVVFIYLYDASAVNTLIECVVRNTPIVINYIPAVVEILGEDYPLYYRKNPSKVITLENIKLAFEYLTNLDKTKLKIETFVSRVLEVIKTA